MSTYAEADLALCSLIAVAIMASMFIFVPLLDVCGPQCQRLFLRKPKTLQQEGAEPLQEAA